MKEKTVVEKKRNSPPRGAGGTKKSRRYTPDEKLKAVRLRLEEGFSVQDVCGEMGMAVSWQFIEVRPSRHHHASTFPTHESAQVRTALTCLRNILIS